ncbi:MAG: tRNA (adenosine(37)-N6)-threonylcarbamoyltransferase complex transferase subunit TsaD [Holosporaceae bacterium]|jgi:N6-L-threonylcarbamoyladenine synthase|nr:tRNA (adenosine(37)-N6)-threonylcarbamoyltransferase complex transferase subunit TsaD [Holosporaceae bacterium]
MNVLGIESSCDETAAAIVTEKKQVLSNVIYSQIEEHKSFGGVVPEIAARTHLEKIDVVVEKALHDAGVNLSEIDAVAGTCGPGLIGSVIVGATFAKTISMSINIPFIAINHIEAHAISVRLTEDVEFPYLLLLASGGHSQLCIVHAIDNFEILGKTIDDSVGESFDKIAKLLGLGYPGGPIVEKVARCGNAEKFSLPRPLCTKGSCDFSFAGLKTAVRVAAEKCVTEQDKVDLVASFQKTVTDVMVFKVKQAIDICDKKITAVAMAGGVAANKSIRAALNNTCNSYGLPFFSPPLQICTDNGAMIAWLGLEKFHKKQFTDLQFAPCPRWSLQQHGSFIKH